MVGFYSVFSSVVDLEFLSTSSCSETTPLNVVSTPSSASDPLVPNLTISSLSYDFLSIID